jgi:2-phospho-L-lactate guanylyltransferase (CobY/MobA/RfbA family)
MATVVVPFRGTDPKQRLALADEARRLLADAMLADVAAAASVLGEVLVVAPAGTRVPGGTTRGQAPRRVQGAAVRSRLDQPLALGLPAPYLVVHADLPCAASRDLLALAGAVPDGGLAVAPAGDGTTNALALAGEALFRPVYGPGSAERFAALGPSATVAVPNLADDVDTLVDLRRLHLRLGPRSQMVLASLPVEAVQ